MLRFVKNGLATFRKSRCSGGSISMIVRICPSGVFARFFITASWSWLRIVIPSRLLKTSGRPEMSMMSACFVMAQNGW